jgi:hypothetical protein
MELLTEEWNVLSISLRRAGLCCLGSGGRSSFDREMKRISQIIMVWLVVAGAIGASAASGAASGASVQSCGKMVSSLVDPAKLRTLGEHGANPRVQKYVALMAEAKAGGVSAKKVAAEAVALVGMKGDAARLTAEAMVENLKIAERSGCLDADGLAEMRSGQSPTVRRGPSKGDRLSVDHIIPWKVAPELDKVIANLRLMPLNQNVEKHAKIGPEQVALARKLNKAGLLSKQGLAAVERAR